jgi:hypothetical protein
MAMYVRIADVHDEMRISSETKNDDDSRPKFRQMRQQPGYQNKIPSAITDPTTITTAAIPVDAD